MCLGLGVRVSTDQVAAAGTRHPSRLARPAIGWLHWAGLGPALPHQHQSHAPTHHTGRPVVLSEHAAAELSIFAAGTALPGRCQGKLQLLGNCVRLPWLPSAGWCWLVLPGAWPRLLETFHSSAFIRQLPVTDTPGAGAGDPHGAGTKYHTLLFFYQTIISSVEL